MLKRFFSRLRAAQKAKSERRANQKTTYFWKSRQWKFGISLAAVILVIIVVLFNKQIDTLLRLWGIKANEMGWVTVTVDPNTNDVYPNQLPPANIAEYNLTIAPEQGDLWLIPPETEGLTSIEIDKINIFRGPITIDRYIDNMILDNQGIPVNFDFAKNQFDLSSNPIVFSNRDPNPDLPQTFRLTIITKPGIPPLISDITGTFDIAVSGIFYETRAGGEMGTGMVVNYPVGFILNLLAAGAVPDFSLEITSPAGEPAGNDVQITAGNDAPYTITVTAINGFRGIVNLQHTGFTDYMPPLGDVITGIDFPTAVDIDDDTPHDVALVVHTNGALIAPVDINFTVRGIDVMGNIRSDNGILHIIPAPPAPDFQITATPSTGMPRDELLRYVTYPGGQVQYNITVLREDLWGGVVEADVVWSDEDAAARDIERVEFDNGGHFTEGSTQELAVLTIHTTTTATAEDLTFYVRGLGDLDGLEPLEERITKSWTFSIMDFSIALSPLNQTVGDGETANYLVRLTPLNQFNGTIRFSVVPNSLTDYQNYIAAERFDFPIYIWHVSGISPIINLSIDTKAYDPGNSLPYPKDIPFRVRATVLLPFVGLAHNSNEGQLHIVTAQDFAIGLSFVPSTEQPAEMAWPGGTIKYQVFLTRLKGWSGAVDLTHNLIIGWPSEIASVVFANGGTFPAASGNDSTLMTITIKTTASAIRVNRFSVFGTGNVGGIDVTHSVLATFDIINFTITVTPEPPHNGETLAGEVHDDIIYRVTLTPLNMYTGMIVAWLDTNLTTNPAWDEDINSFWFDDPFLTAVSTTQPFTFLHIKTLITISEKDIIFTVTGEDKDKHLADGITHLTNSGNALLRVLPRSGNPAFTIAVMPASRTVVPGGNTTYAVIIYPIDNFRGTVNLNHNLIHQAVDSALLDLNSLVVTDIDLNPSTTLRVQTNTSVYPIGIPFTVRGISNDYGAPITAVSNDAYLFITDLPNFELYITPNERTVQPGQTADYTVYIIRSSSFMGNVNLSTNVGSFAGIAGYSFDNNPLTLGNDSTTLHVSTVSPFNNATINFNVSGSGTPGVRTALATLYIVNIVQPAFSILIDPDTRTVAPGGSTSYDVLVTATGGFIGRIDLTHNLLHSSIQSAVLKDNYLIFNPGDIQLSTRLNVTVFPAVPNATIYFTVHGDETAGPLEATSNQATLIITNQPDFTLTLVPSENSGFPGERVDYTLNLTRLNGFTGNVTAFITTDQPGLIADITIENNGIFDTTTGDDLLVSITTMANAIAQDILITAHGTAVGIVGERTDDAILHVVDFIIYVTPQRMLGRRGSTVIYLVELVRNNNFDRAINLSTSLTGNINLSDVGFANGGVFPAQVGGDQETNLNVEIAPDARVMDIPFIVTGTDLTSAQQREDNAILTIYEVTILVDFTITISPDSQTVEPGGSTAYTITITRLNGHTGDITLTTDLAIKNPNEIESAKFEDTVISVGEDSTILNVKTKDTARNSTDPITFNVWGDTITLSRADSADLIIYKTTGGGGTTVTPPVVPPVVEPPKEEPEIQIPEALPSTGPDAWLWLVVATLLAISIPQSTPKKKKRAK